MSRTKQRWSGASRAKKTRPPRWMWIAGSFVALGLVVGIYVSRSKGSTPSEAVRSNDPGVAHIHGLGINPANGDLYAATHTGVFRIDNGRATRIADRYQDTMGFTVIGPNHFIASGHPDLREELPPLLGLLESRDAGRTWTKKSLLGKADFHALRHAHGDVWGYDSTSGTLMVTKDGEQWDARSSLVLRDFVVSPHSPKIVLATTSQGLRRSEDGGRTWQTSQAPTEPLLLAWEGRNQLWLVTEDGEVYQAADAGRPWDLRGRLKGEPEAFVAERDALFVATHRGIFTSSDASRTWRLFYSDEREQPW